MSLFVVLWITFVALIVGLLVLWWALARDFRKNHLSISVGSTGRSGYYDDPRTFMDDSHTGWEEEPPVP